MASVIDRGDGSDLTRVISLLKKKGVLPAENKSSAAKEIYQSDTGEITLFAAESQFTLVTPRAEGALLKEGGRASLQALRLVGTTCAASIAVLVLDAKAIPESKRLLLVYATDAVNSGLETSPDRVTLVHPGELPILVETGTVTAEIKNASAPSMKCYALGMDGRRREAVSLEAADGLIRVKVDTASLTKGPALFFELGVD
ncbi:MAG: hypothetical protein J0L75_00595 [Spirochaetes bacterium]|nr:hypothetical protein [Spirochaetota bacterium]